MQDEHDQQEHACAMGDRCYYSSPPDYEQSGICGECLDSEVITFFCSEECYSQSHHHDAHGGSRGMDSFIQFQLGASMKLD
jgi:hypothetical protein